MQISGEKLSTDEITVSQFTQDLNTKIAKLGLTPEQLYNADETGSNWRQLSQRKLM